MTIEALRELVNRLSAPANALAAVGAVLEAHASGHPLDPSIAPHVEQVLGALGAREVLDGVGPLELRPLLGELRTFALSNAKLLFASSPRGGWDPTDDRLLLAAGDVSSGLPRHLERTIAPKLPGLGARLASPGAAFLDVGVGVAALSIEMARLWPSLRIVGIDPHAPALDLARDNVKEAGLDGRIELRHQTGQELPDRDAFDLAWIPGVFIAEEAIASILGRVLHALLPGGWVLLAMLKTSADPLVAALIGLRAAMFGGFIGTPEQMEECMRALGFTEVQTLYGPATFTAMLAARRQPETR